MLKKNLWATPIFYAVLVSMLIALTSYAYLGTFTRYMADDYCTAAVVKSMDFWSAQAYWWQNWSGRYSFTFTISLMELVGLAVIPILPALIMFAWVCSIVWVCVPILKHYKMTNYLAGSIFVACLALWLTYKSVDDYPQVVFWQTGILTYPISAILFLLGTGIFIRRASNDAKVSWRELLGWFLFALLAGGFSETGTVIQITVTAYLLIFVSQSKIEQRKSLTPVIWSTLAGSVLSLLTIAAAPGNLVRSQGFANVPPLGMSTIGLLKNFLLFMPDLLDKNTITMVLGFLGGMFLVYCCMPDDGIIGNLTIAKSFVASVLLAAIGILSSLAPAYILRGALPPERVLLISYFLMACIVIHWGALCALLLRLNLPPETRIFQGWISGGLLIFLIIWGVSPVVVSRIQLTPSLRQYSMIWDARHEYLLAASQNGDSTIFADDLMKIEALRKLRTKLWVTGDLETSSDYWINVCTAQYYGVEEIIAK